VVQDRDQIGGHGDVGLDPIHPMRDGMAESL
jgi:hypothetical protein